MCKVYTGYCGTSEIEHGLCARTVDNPLAKARGLSLRTGAQTMLYLSLVSLITLYGRWRTTDDFIIIVCRFSCQVWYFTDVLRLVVELKNAYPYSYSALHNKVGALPQTSWTEAPCMTSMFIFQFLPCLSMHCSSSAGEESFLACAESKCDLLKLEQHCISCLIMSESVSPVQR